MKHSPKKGVKIVDMTVDECVALVTRLILTGRQVPHELTERLTTLYNNRRKP